ncbi:MAG: hypothetical protein JW719_09350 [Pirellulales bacterium]|nr:hypothetical protein [Pirellulales bacterium]
MVGCLSFFRWIRPRACSLVAAAALATSLGLAAVGAKAAWANQPETTNSVGREAATPGAGGNPTAPWLCSGGPPRMPEARQSESLSSISLFSDDEKPCSPSGIKGRPRASRFPGRMRDGAITGSTFLGRPLRILFCTWVV